MDISPEQNISHPKDEKIIEAMARAACLAAGYSDPDLRAMRLIDLVEVHAGRAWLLFIDEARRHYIMHNAMTEALGENQ